MAAPVPPAQQEEEKFHWEGIEVPKDVHHSLSQPWRGQKFGQKLSALMSVFTDTPKLVKTVDGKYSVKVNVRTRVGCVHDSSFHSELAPDKINATKLLEKLLN